MEDDTPGSEDLLRQFEEAISGMGLDDLQKLSADLTSRAWRVPALPERPHLRRPPRDEVAVYRVRVDLKRARPPIWRRLDLRSDLTLDVVHRALQAAFGWLDYHLHRFALGGDPFDPRSELFLCAFDVEEGEDEGVPASEVRLDETLQEPGDVLSYAYDYGDSWELTIRLEEVLSAEKDTPAAVCVDGRRAAPPEDCGGLTTVEELAEVLDDPAHFDVAEVNLALNDPYFVLSDAGMSSQLVELAYRLGPADGGEDLLIRLLSLAEPAPVPSTEEKAAALTAFLWYLEGAEGNGFELTAAGYLRPADVKAASQLVPTMADWRGTPNREVNAYPLVQFRETLRKLGLVRKYKGRLRSTRAGAKVATNPAALWDFLAGKLAEGSGERFDDEAGLLLLAHVATSSDGTLSLEAVADALTALGWRYGDGRPVERYDVYHLDTYTVLRNVGQMPDHPLGSAVVSREAIALARAALHLG